MKSKHMTAVTRFGLLVAAIALLQGCAGSPAKNANDALADSLGNDNLDVLFATEFPVASKQEAMAKSNAAFREGDLDKALFYSVRALRFDPSDVDVLVRIGHLHMRQGNGKLAALAFGLALQQQPEHALSLQGLGLLYYEAGKREKAREYLERAVAGDANLWQSWNVLGVLADDRREYTQAGKYYDAALKVRPDAVIVRINRGWSRYLAGDLDEAARELFAIATSSDHPTAWRNLGMVYARKGWYEEATNVFRKVEDDASAYNRTGEIALDNSDLDIAYDYFSEALRQSPVYFAAAEQNMARLNRARNSAR